MRSTGGDNFSKAGKSEKGSGGESFSALFESATVKSDKMRDGDVVQGTVVRVTKDAVIVDIGFKSEGTIPLSEFQLPTGEVTVKVGDTVDVAIESREDSNGLVQLSKERADRDRALVELREAFKSGQVIEGTITGRVPGGLGVTLRGGIKAFLPGSQVDVRQRRNLDHFIGQTSKFKVLKFDDRRANIVLSRKDLLTEERTQMKAKTLEHLNEGMVVEGIVKNITEYGAFVDLGGIDGLLHITDMSWGRVDHPQEVVAVGAKITVRVLKYNAETEKVSLGLKQISEDPWLQVSATYTQGKRVKGKVVSLTDYGAFVELEQGVEGLIHVSEMSWRKPKHPSKLLTEGQEIECVVLDVDTRAKRISLGLKQLEPDPWTAFTNKYNAGDVIRGKVRSVTDYGVFVGIEEGVDGMVHKSDLSWTQRINNPADVYHKGDEVEAIILSINHEEKKVSLGIKQLYEDPWTRIPEQYPARTVLEVRVLSITEFGVFVELERGVEGLIHISELTNDTINDPREIVREGDIVKAEIIGLDSTERRISLSTKNTVDREVSRARQAEHAAAQPAREPTKVGPSGRSSPTLGDVLKEQLGERMGDITKST